MKSKLRYLSIVQALAALVCSCVMLPLARANSNLLTNGDFESEPSWGGGVGVPDSGETALIGSELPGWTIEPNHAVTIHISSGPYLVIGGAYSVNTDGEGYDGHNANFYQDFSSSTNLSYALSFDWQSWGYHTNPTPSQLKISVTDTVTSAALFIGLYNYDGNAPHPVHTVTTNLLGTGNTLRLRIEESPESGYNDNTYVVDNFGVLASSPQLFVTILPAGAIAAGAQWQLDGGAFQNSGVTVSNLSAGNHTVAFNSISGWIAPTNQTVSLTPGSTATITGTYSPIGALQVTISPADAVSAGAQWQVDGGAFQNSGVVVTNLTVGDHTVAFKTISGWNTPGNQVVAIVSGATNSASGTYIALGALQVTLSPPAAVSAGAQWQVDGGAFQNSGSVVTNLVAGNHTVSFNTVSGWVAPGDLTAGVSAHSTNTYSGTYTVAPSAVRVFCVPVEAVAAGAQWQLDGGAFQNSGVTVGNLAAGDYTVAFNNISGWITPTNQTVSLTPGNTATITGTYAPIGALQVTISPTCAVVAGAQWRVDGGPFQNSGAVVTNLAGGKREVSFNSVVGWTAPGNQTVTVNAGITTIATAVYTQGSTPGTITWTSGGGPNHNWSNPANWDLNRAPTNTDIVLIPYTDGSNNCLLDVNTNVAGLLIGECAGGGSDGLNLNGHTLEVDGPITVKSSAAFTISNSGTLIGASNTIISGVIGWTAGGLVGTFTIASNSVVNIALASNDHYLGNCVVTNYGTVNWRDDILYAGGSSPATVIYNYGLWNAEDDRALSTTFFGGNIVFDNFGTFRKSGGASGGYSQMQADVTFNNTGTVDVQQGNLRLEGGGNFSGGSITTNGAGTTILVSGSYNLNGTATGTNLVEDGADLIGTTVINGGLTWFAGSWIGAVTVASNSVVNIARASNAHYLGNCIVSNYGTVNWRDDILYAGCSIPATVI